MPECRHEAHSDPRPRRIPRLGLRLQVHSHDTSGWVDASATVEAFDPYRYDQVLVTQLTKGYRQLVDEAEAEVETLSVEEAHRVLADGSRLIVDIRDVRELSREGKIPGAFHAPRGMLEFWVDPESPKRLWRACL